MRAQTQDDRPTSRATDREVGVVAAVLVAGSEKAAAHSLGLSHSTVKHHLANARSKVGAETTAQLVWILAPRLPEPEARPRQTSSRRPCASRPDQSKPITPHLHPAGRASSWSSPTSLHNRSATRPGRPSAIRLGAAPNCASGTVS